METLSRSWHFDSVSCFVAWAVFFRTHYSSVFQHIYRNGILCSARWASYSYSKVCSIHVIIRGVHPPKPMKQIFPRSSTSLLHFSPLCPLPPLSSLILSSPPLLSTPYLIPLDVGPIECCMLGGLWSAVSSPTGCGRSPSRNRIGNILALNVTSGGSGVKNFPDNQTDLYCV